MQTDWTPPLRLSTGQGDGSQATMVEDSFGYLHVFWTEALDDERTLLQYARFDGSHWSASNDIYISREFFTIENVTAAVDPSGRLYVMWPEGNNGPAYYSSAPAHNALSAHNWEPRYRVNIPASFVKLQIDSQGVFHVLYTRILGEERGVYYVRSTDQGISWSKPLWLDPDILPDHMPTNLEFAIDEQDGLHATWYYFSADFTGGDWVRYTHSLDNGQTWSLPFTIDRLEASEVTAGEELSAADPVLAVQGQNVHVIWAGGELHYRHHRYSEDRGQTWSPPIRVFGDLNGQAGDGMTVDGAGRVHFFGQIRFPMGIYHAIWNQGQWSDPVLIYLIKLSGEDEFGDEIHAHNTVPSVRAGNQLILTLADPPPEDGRRLFFMQHTLEDVSTTALQPTPTATAQATPQASATPLPLETIPTPSFDPELTAPSALPRPDYAVWIGIAPIGLLMVGMICFRLWSKFRQ